MGRIGYGYGSEWHLFRYLGRHRNALDREVLRVSGSQEVTWMDFHFSAKDEFLDAEWEGIDFLFAQDAPVLMDRSHLRESWAAFWPQSGRQQTWDAIGILRTGSQREWLLVEAKAHTAEMRTERGCGASGASRSQIEAAFTQVGSALGVPDTSTWTGGHYQYANRLATLWFLLEHGIPARLLYIYFVSDTHGQDCPASEEGWQPGLKEQDQALGLDLAENRQMIEEAVHKLFLPVMAGSAASPTPPASPPSSPSPTGTPRQ